MSGLCLPQSAARLKTVRSKEGRGNRKREGAERKGKREGEWRKTAVRGGGGGRKERDRTEEMRAREGGRRGDKGQAKSPGVDAPAGVWVSSASQYL